MRAHITKTTQACFFQLTRLRQMRCLLGRDVTASLIATFILSRLDYCNALLTALPQSTMAPFAAGHECSSASRVLSRIQFQGGVTQNQGSLPSPLPLPLPSPTPSPPHPLPSLPSWPLSLEVGPLKTS